MVQWLACWEMEQDSKRSVWQTQGTAYHLANTFPTAKHGGGGLMLWPEAQSHTLEWLQDTLCLSLSQSPDLNLTEHDDLRRRTGLEAVIAAVRASNQ